MMTTVQPARGSKPSPEFVRLLRKASAEIALRGASCPDRLEGNRLLALSQTVEAEARIQGQKAP